MNEHRRWLTPALVLSGVALIGFGIVEMLRVSYNQHPSWTPVIIAPMEMILGSALVLFPLLRRLAHEAAEDDEDTRQGEAAQDPSHKTG